MHERAKTTLMPKKSPKKFSPAADALPARWSEDMVRALGFFNLLRFGLGSFFLAMIYFKANDSNLGTVNPNLFFSAAVTLTFSSFAYFAWTNASRETFNLLTFFQFLIDILCVTAVIHSSGGMTSSINMLLLINVAAGSVVMRYQYGVTLALIAIFLLTGEHFYSILEHDQKQNFQRLAIICAAILTTSLLISAIANRARIAEAKADRQNESILALSAINNALVQDLDIGILVVDRAGRIETSNAASLDLLGHEDPSSASKLEHIHSDLAHRYKLWLQGKSESIVQVYNKINGDAIHLELERFGKKGSLTKITINSRKEIQEKAHQMTLAAMGRMATGIAHEVRNPLMTISSASELLASKRYASKNDVRAIKMISDNCERINNLIEEILNVGRNSETHAEDIDLLKWLKSFLYDYCSYGNIPLSSIKLYCQPLIVRFSIQHLHQVATNLCDNAFRYGDPSEEQPLQVVAREYKNRYVIDFVSPGEKIRDDLVEKIFEPFFSTGKKQGGTGLGLYLCREICALNMAKLSYVQTYTDRNCFRITIQRSSNHELSQTNSEITI